MPWLMLGTWGHALIAVRDWWGRVRCHGAYLKVCLVSTHHDDLPRLYENPSFYLKLDEGRPSLFIPM
jgi:hypothetical protein